ncbi:MAG TPA: bifunctional oligoribonuclease/PAP phosphatase NrnA [Syntrophomonadaceae bacterium]|nr:bifunctional oligoribonuclease/PAP phosphatase NrnA [Syntrophomonadaceae bacterium]
MEVIEDIVKILKTKQSFVLTTHIHADGDAIGSLLALGLALLNSGKNAVMIHSEPVPESYRFLPGAEQVIMAQDLKEKDGFEIGIALDCTNLNRAGDAEQVLRKADCIINIDHHISNEYFGQINMVETEAAATGEMVCNLLVKGGFTITPDIATDLYTAIITDTGSFRHQNTTANCFRTSAFLLECGAAHSFIQHNLYEQRSLQSLRFMVNVLQTLTLNENGLIAWMTISRDMITEEDNSEGLIDYAKSLKGVEVGILFKELDSGEIKVSFRSKSFVDVNQLAAHFGGGGHERAAGCSIKGSLKEVEQLVIRKTEEYLSKRRAAE